MTNFAGLLRDRIDKFHNIFQGPIAKFCSPFSPGPTILFSMTEKGKEQKRCIKKGSKDRWACKILLKKDCRVCKVVKKGHDILDQNIAIVEHRIITIL